MKTAENKNAERRRHPRTQLQMTLRGIRMDPDGDMVDTFHMMDISRSGLGAVVDVPYYRGQRVILSLPMPCDGGRRNVYATVVRCRSNEDGYHLGMQFDNPASGVWTNMAENEASIDTATALAA